MSSASFDSPARKARSAANSWRGSSAGLKRCGVLAGGAAATSMAALRRGATDYLVKPVQFPRLKKILAQLTALSPASRPLSASVEV